MPELKLLESDPIGMVEVTVDGRFKGRHRDYREAAEWLERNHPQDWAQQSGTVYREYKDDYDRR